ncbi:uncharacterized protein LOC133632478 [Entelurus aequoreus]|uniref:uncharacterized protein LOC133632478 n=1 Tax=Entelurus aequoreus TaxID=161455 RepID=UPI002B1E308E|nr:uncharacterized protein LOC133632478 [Entelurus aequoreus]
MGKETSKPKVSPKDKLTCKDWKAVEIKNPDLLKFLDDWISKHKFTGCLKVGDILKLTESIIEKCGSNRKKLARMGWDHTGCWMRMAQNREDGERQKKKEEQEERKIKSREEGKERAKRDEKLMFHRTEDYETGTVRRRTRQFVREDSEDESSEEEVQTKADTHSAPTTTKHQSAIYPDLNKLQNPPPYNESVTTQLTVRSKRDPKNSDLKWSKKQGVVFSPKPKKTTQDYNLDDEELYPLIEVANPRAGEHGQVPTLLVHRTWTLVDVKKALKEVTPYTEDVTQFLEGMENLRRSYHLNGMETQTAWMTALGPKWHQVRGNWDPMGINIRGGRGIPLEHDHDDLRNRVRDLMARVEQRFQKRANYTELGRTKQKDEETFEDYKIRLEKTFKQHSGLNENADPQGPYQQQLKNILHANSRQAIHEWVNKHYIGFPTGTLDEYINHALHAEKVTNKKRAKVSTDTFYHEEENSEMYYTQNKGRGRGQFREQFRGQFRGQGRSGRGG